jgi:hypothetical protein
MLHCESKTRIIWGIFIILLAFSAAGNFIPSSAWGDNTGAVTPLPPQQAPTIGNDSLSTPISSAAEPTSPGLIDIIVLIIVTSL